VTSTAEELPVHRLRAHNAATASENKIHDDAVARRHGFSGGLVPGITVFGYMTGPVVEAWGEAWLERGTMNARFRRPTYDGVEVVVRGSSSAADGIMTAELTLANSSGEVCAVATATLGDAPAAAPDLRDHPRAPLPGTRVRPTPEAIAAVGELGTVDAGFHADRADETLALVGADLPIYRALGVAHPTWLLFHANALLAANVALGPWIHTASDVGNLSTLHDGERLSARGRVARLEQRKGNEIVDLDVLLVADDRRPVMALRHTAIYSLRKPGHTG
jgi:acyl dehydratase